MRGTWLRDRGGMVLERSKAMMMMTEGGQSATREVCVILHGLDWDVANQGCLYPLPKAPKTLLLEDHRHDIPARCLSSILCLLEVLHSDLRVEWSAWVGFIPPSSLNKNLNSEDGEVKGALNMAQRDLQKSMERMSAKWIWESAAIP